MIKLICFIRKRAEIDVPTFQKHWREEHGPLIKRLPRLRRHLVRYEQNHRLDSDYVRDAVASSPSAPQAAPAAPQAAPAAPQAAPAYDGSTIMWFSSMDAYHAFAAEPDYAEYIAPDEARFMNRAETLFFFTHEEEVKLGDAASRAQASVKLLALLRRRADLSAEAFHAHWSGAHADLLSQHAPLRTHILAYQQNHRFPEDYIRDPATRWDGLAEWWSASVEEFCAGAGGTPFDEIVAPDEERFIDRPATQFILSKPPEIIVA